MHANANSTDFGAENKTGHTLHYFQDTPFIVRCVHLLDVERGSHTFAIINLLYARPVLRLVDVSSTTTVNTT